MMSVRRFSARRARTSDMSRRAICRIAAAVVLFWATEGRSQDRGQLTDEQLKAARKLVMKKLPGNQSSYYALAVIQAEESVIANLVKGVFGGIIGWVTLPFWPTANPFFELAASDSITHINVRLVVIQGETEAADMVVQHIVKNPRLHRWMLIGVKQDRASAEQALERFERQLIKKTEKCPVPVRVLREPQP